MTDLKTDRDLVELLRRRVRTAQAAVTPDRWIWEILGHLADAIKEPFDSADPAVLAVARALLGEDTGQDNSADIPRPEIAERDYERLEITLDVSLDDRADEMSSEHAQRITQALLSGEYGRGVAVVVTRLMMNLARGRDVQLRGLDTEGGEQS